MAVPTQEPRYNPTSEPRGPAFPGSVVVLPRVVGLPLPNERPGELPLHRPLLRGALAHVLDLPGPEADPSAREAHDRHPTEPAAARRASPRCAEP